MKRDGLRFLIAASMIFFLLAATPTCAQPDFVHTERNDIGSPEAVDRSGRTAPGASVSFQARSHDHAFLTNVVRGVRGSWRSLRVVRQGVR